MYVGQLPGYYYDEEKQKYFKVQANHVAPTGAKYTKSNVKREQRETKKRKIDHQQREERFKQTVRPAQSLEHPLAGGIGLRRELGLRELVVDSADRDAFFVSQLEPSKVDALPPNNACAHGRIFDATGVEDTGDIIFAYDHAPNSSIYVIKRPEGLSEIDFRRTRMSSKALVACSSSLAGLHVVNRSDAGLVLIALARDAGNGGNLFINKISPFSAADFFQSFFVTLGSRHTYSAWSSSVSPTSELLAVSGTTANHIVDIATARAVVQLGLSVESRSNTWLDTQTVAYGEGKKVRLWDLRSKGTATRYRRSLPITGLRSLDKNGVQLLVSDNKGLFTYDTRMHKKPLLSFTHTHQGPQLQFACQDNVVAALDVDNDVQTYSLRTGKSLGRLQRPGPRDHSLMTSLKWRQEKGRPVLQACWDLSVVQWTFGGKDDDEA